MKSLTQKIAIGYTLWILFWVGIIYFTGSGEIEISAFIYLTITGLPFSLLGWEFIPHAGVRSILIVGGVGLFQWCLLIELDARISTWWKERNKKD